MKKKFLILLTIVLLGFFLRIYHINIIPPSASLDEASIGWNAYSILQTGKDEYGYKLPLLLRAYDDWRPALYVYLVVPLVKLMGLNVVAVRLPSVILSIFAIFSVFYLVKYLFFSYKDNDKIALISCLFLAISPWGIYVSRLGHEANVAFSFGIFAITFFLIFVRTYKSKYVYFSSVFFALSFYAYQSEKVFIPLFVIALSIIFKKDLVKLKKHVLLAGILGIIILAPIIKETLSPNGLSRFSGTSVYNVNAPEYFQASIRRRDARASGDLFTEIINNNRIIYIQEVSRNYISHFNPVWLFTNGVSSDFKAPGSGLLYFFQLPLIFLGFIKLFKKIDKKTAWVVLSWIILTPIASAVTTGAPHALRSYSFLPTWQILGALGSVYLMSLSRKNIYKNLLSVVLVILIVANFTYFLKQYFIFFPKADSTSFQYALSRAIPYVLENQNSYKKIVFSNRRNLYQSYMFFLFYSKFDPVLYQKLGGTKSGGYDVEHSFLKYEFRPISSIESERGTLYIRNSLNFPKEMTVIKQFSSLNGENTIFAVTMK